MKPVAMDGSDDTVSQSSDEPLVALQIYVPDLLLQKCMHFHRDELIWDVKHQIIASLPKELKESFNYGLFCPPVNGKAGKFLDEERPLVEYPFPEPGAFLELRYKRRIYKMMNVEEKQVKQMHTRANLRRLLENVGNGNVEKVSKLCARGLDPNFHCPETGETPLSIATGLPSPAKMILTLVNGGSLLDFRTKDGKTALHRAVEKDNFDSLKTLLDLGSSPNYKDSRGLTSLYYSVLYSCDPRLTELLLHDHAIIGSTDPQGWQEVHQACKHGLVQHLEHLLFYGADMNAHNASGNTPLHVCAVNDQESCARVLLFRGADKEALNYANQNPYQVAIIAGNLTLGEIIQNHRPEDVVPYREVPKYNPRRRASSMAPSVLNRAQSDPHLEALGIACSPLSPCPSSQYPFSSSVSTISEASSTGSSSSATTQMGSETEDTASGITDKSMLSDSSGVCTSHSGTSYEDSGSELLPEGGTLGPLRPGAICVCLEDYQVPIPGHLSLIHGDLVEVLGLTESGLYQGKTREGEEGLFPPQIVQEVKMRSEISPSDPPKQRVEGRREMSARKVSTVPRRWRLLESHYGEPRTVILHKGKKGFGFVLRGAKATSPLMERQPSEYWPSLQYLDDVDKGGVADMAGLKKGDFLLEINGQDVSQASHEHVVTIIRHSGDLVAMTVVTVQPPNSGQSGDQRSLVPRRQCATLPRKLSTKKAPVPPKRDPKTTLSVGRARARSMVAGLAEIEVLDRSLNEYDSEGRSTKSSSIESIPNKQSTTTTPSEASSSTHNTNNSGSPALAQKIASIRSRPSSRRITATELEDFFSRQKSEIGVGGTLPSHLARGPKVYGSMAALKRGVKGVASRRIGLSTSDARLHKEFHSSPDLNGVEGNPALCNSNRLEQGSDVGDLLLKRRSHSQEDLQALMMSRHQHSWACPPHAYSQDRRDALDYKDAWKSVEEIYERVKAQDEEERRETDSGIYAETLPLTAKSSSNSSSSTSALPTRAPPPSHPPPPPPVGQVVKVDVSRAMGEYANVVRQEKTTVMSSFRPGDSAKLYESPDAVMTGSIGIKKEAKRTPSGPRSQSLPPRIAAGRPPYRAPSSEAESSGDSLYSAFKVLHRPGKEQAEGTTTERTGTLKGVKGKNVRPYSPKFCPEVDSEVESPPHPHPHHSHHHYHSGGTLRNHHPSHEPFIPEPDYDSSSSEDEPTDKGTLVTFGKTEEIPNENHEEMPVPACSPHTEAKKAIAEAKHRLRGSEIDPAQKSTSEQIKKVSSPPEAPVGDETTTATSPGHSEVLLVNGDTKGKDDLSPVVEVTSTSVRENISVFERKSENSVPPQPQSQLMQKSQCLPPHQQQQSHSHPQPNRTGESQAAALRRLNEGIKTALSGTLTRLNQERCHAQMKTSKSCPKDFVGEDNSSSGVSSDIETASADDQSPFGGMHGSCTLPHQILNRHQQNYHMQQQQQQGRAGIVRKGSLPDAGALVALKNRMGHHTAHQGTDRRVRHVTPNTTNSEGSSRRPVKPRSRLQDDDADETDMEDEEYVRRAQPGGAVRVPVDSLGLAAVNEVDVMTELLPPPPEFAIAGASEAHAPHSQSHQHHSHDHEAFAPPPPQFSDESLMMMRRAGVQRAQAASRMRQVTGAQQYRYHQDYMSRSATLQHSHKQQALAQQLQQQQLYGTLRESKQAQNMHRPVAAEVVRAAEAARAAEMARAAEIARMAEAARQVVTTAPKPQQKEFRVKCLHEWTCRDVCDWLDSLFLSEYKSCFTEAGITGAKLSNMDNNDLMGLGVKQVGHRLNMERSIKRYLK